LVLHLLAIEATLANAGQLRLSSATSSMIRRLSLVPVFVSLGLLFLPFYPAPAAPLSENETIKLPGGNTVKILSVSRIEYSKGVMALMVRYQTKLSVEERQALSAEVDDVFKVAQKQVERDGFHEAIISSNEVPHGVILTTNRMLNFIFERGSDGLWTRLGRSEFMAAE
jgi:hypothetical protein